METYITTCKTESQWEFAVWLRRLKQGLCINLQGRMLLVLGAALGQARTLLMALLKAETS